MIAALLLGSAAVAAEPIHPERWINKGYHQSGLVRSDVSGVMRFRLTIASDGRTIRCEIPLSSGVVGFDAHICALLTARAAFHPARNGQDMPAFAIYEGRAALRGLRKRPSISTAADYIVKLQRFPLGLGIGGIVSVVLDIDAAGKILNCQVNPETDSKKADAKLGAVACQQASALDPDPVFDGDGKPVATVRDINVGFKIDGA